jgi:thiamine-monophosphate kinase
MTATSAFSDEPGRVAQLVTAFLSAQSGSVVSPAELPEVVLSVGADARDDCAIYDVSGPVSLVVGSDYVRGAKFILYELGVLSGFDIGYYLVVANVSDIAAMGAAPIGVLTVIRYPNDVDDREFHEIMAGIHQACTDSGTLNVGGDIGNAERVVLSGTALGICERGKSLQRSGAGPGDVLCVTGPCGLLGAAVAYFPKRDANGWTLPTDVEQALLDSWRRPRARVAEGRILSLYGYGTACQDTSDGLKATIEQIAAASDVGFDVFEDSIPMSAAVERVAQLLDVDATTLALSASSDFQLVFTIDAASVDSCTEAFLAAGLTMYVIGKATPSAHGIRMLDRDSNPRPLPGVAWKHQSTDISTLVPDGDSPSPA